MATRNRDVELGIRVTTAGSEGVTRLKEEVDALAKGGSAAAPEFKALSDELDRLADQARSLEAFDQISRDIDALSLAQKSASVSANALSTELADATTKANGFRASQDQAARALLEQQDALKAARIDLAAYKNENKDAIGTTDAYKKRVQELAGEIIRLRKEVADKTSTLREAKKATSEAEAEESKLERAYANSAKQAKQANDALLERERAQRTALNTLSNLGVETDNLTQSEIGLVNAIVLAQEETQRLAQEQRDAAEAAERQAQEAAALAEAEKQAAKSYSQWWEQALYDREQAEQKATAAQKATAEEAKRTGQAIKDALGTVGVRSTEELRIEIQNVRNALELLKSSGTLAGAELDNAMAVGERRIKELERQAREASGQLTVMDRVSKGLNSTFAQFAGAFTLVEVVQRLTRSFFDATRQIETLRLALGTIYGSTRLAAQQIEFLQKTAGVAGINVGAISDAFVKFSASTKSANIPLEQTNALFGAVAQAAGTLGLSGDKVNHILDALSQIAAKGVVSMEELRQQLGDSLPGALSLTAKGLGLTEAELIKVVESGGLLARDLFPALTNSLKSLGGEVNTFTAAWERLKNATTLTFQAIGDAGVLVVLKEALNAAKAALDIFGLGLVTLLNTIRLVFEGTGTFIGVLIGSGSLSEALKASGEKSQEAADRLLAYRNGMFSATDAATKQTQKLLEVNKGTAEQQAATAKATAEIRANTEATVGQGVAVEATGIKASLAGKNWVQLQVGLAEATKVGEEGVIVAEKLAKAKEQEGKNTLELAKLTGDESAARATAINTTTAHAAALTSVLTVQETALARQVAYRDALLDEIARLGDADGARLKSLDSINQRIERLAAETERTRQSATEAQNNALALRIEAAALADNSQRVAELKGVRDQMAQSLAVLNELEQRGVNVSANKTLVQQDLVVAEALYRDALNDVTEASQRKIKALQDEMTVAQAKLNLERAELESAKALATAMGNDYKVREINIRLKELDIKVARAKVEATNAEAEATIASANASLAELSATGQLTDAKKAEIESRIANAKAKQLEAQAGAERIKILELELKNLKTYGDSGLDAGRKISDAMREAADAVGKVGSQADSATRSFQNMATAARSASYNRFARPGDAGNEAIADEERAKRLSGNTGPVDNSGMFIARDKLNAGTLTAADIPLIQGVVTAIQNNSKMMNSSTVKSLVGMEDQRQWDVVARRLSESLSSLQSEQPRASAPAATQPASGALGNPTRVIRIDMNGRSTNVNVASDSDATALENLLQQLASAKGSSL